MIKNERQYRITKNQAERFLQTLASLRQRSGETKRGASPHRQSAGGRGEKPAGRP